MLIPSVYGRLIQPNITAGRLRHVPKVRLIKTHVRVSAAKKDMRHTSVLFTGTAKSPFSTPHISITTGPVSIKFTII